MTSPNDPIRRDGFIPDREECNDEVSTLQSGCTDTNNDISDRSNEIGANETIPYNIFNTYGYNARIIAKDIFKICRTYEKPDKNYYIVLTPYGTKKGTPLWIIINMIKKRWSPQRLIVTYEQYNGNYFAPISKRKKINPHYNIIITTKKDIKSSNNNNMNIDVQEIDYIKDLNKVIDYSFKEYVDPKCYNINRCIHELNYYVYIKKFPE